MRTVDVEITIRRKRRLNAVEGAAAAADRAPRIPRITRLMALVIKFQCMVDNKEVHDYADLARLGYVTRARITQIMNLLNLAPSIQEEILLRYRLRAAYVQPVLAAHRHHAFILPISARKLMFTTVGTRSMVEDCGCSAVNNVRAAGLSMSRWRVEFLTKPFCEQELAGIPDQKRSCGGGHRRAASADPSFQPVRVNSACN